MFGFLKRIFGEKVVEPKGAYSSFPESNVDVPMPPTKPPSNQRQSMIEQEAYLLAHQDGCRREPIEYWVLAEQRIDAQIERDFNEECKRRSNQTSSKG